MMNQLPAPQSRRNPKRMLVRFAITLFVVTGLLLASVDLPPFAATPVHALNAPHTIGSQSPTSTEVNGTLASFTALIPEIATISLPIVIR
jgi:hypothetical protein